MDAILKHRIHFLIPAILLVCVASTEIASADFLGIGEALSYGIGWVVANLILFIPNSLLAISSFLLQQSIDPSFIRVPYTTGGIVDIAWPATRDFANMLIVLILIFIGLGTALRLQDYEAKKALPRLIGIAVLINFTPTIMGLVIDTANIIMNFFLSGSLGAQTLFSVGSNATALLNSSSGGFDFGVSFLAKVLAIAMFNLLTAVIFFFFAILFIVRRVIIWILVILSPIAFVSLILPSTKGFFTKWWEQFFQWSTVGIYCAFFLWLGDHVISLAAKGGFTSPSAPQNVPVLSGIGDIMNQIMPFTIADMVLLIGFFMGLQSNAMGFNAVKSTSFSKMKLAGQKTGGALNRWKDDRLANSKFLQGEFGSPETGFANRLATSQVNPTWGEGRSGLTGAALRGAAWTTKVAATPLAGTARKLGRALGPNIRDTQKQDIKKAQGESSKWDVPTVVSRLKDTSISQADKVGYLHRLITDFDIGDAMKLGLTNGEVAQIRESAKRMGEQHEIDVAFPNLMREETPLKIVRERAKENTRRKREGLSLLPELQDLAEAEQNQLITEQFQKDFQGLFASHPERAAWISPSALTSSPEIAEAMLRSFDGRQMGSFAKGAGRSGFTALQTALDRLSAGSTQRKWLENNNRQLLNYVERNAGQDVSLDIGSSSTPETPASSPSGSSSTPETPASSPPPPPSNPAAEFRARSRPTGALRQRMGLPPTP